MDEFRGLASVVEVWRKHCDNQDVTHHMPNDLTVVLDMANEYMTEVEQQTRQRAPDPKVASPAGYCGSLFNHPGHLWPPEHSIGSRETQFWCHGTTHGITVPTEGPMT
jgi:hypothetical protein